MCVKRKEKVREASNTYGSIQKGKHLEERPNGQIQTSSRVKIDPLISTQAVYHCRCFQFEAKCLRYSEHVVTISEGILSLQSSIHPPFHTANI